MFREAADREAAEAAKRDARSSARSRCWPARPLTRSTIRWPSWWAPSACSRAPRNGSEESTRVAQAMGGASRIRDIVARMTHITRIESTPKIGHCRDPRHQEIERGDFMNDLGAIAATVISLIFLAIVGIVAGVAIPGSSWPWWRRGFDWIFPARNK